MTKDRLLVGVLAVATLAAVATAALGFVLADVYFPQGQSSATWEDWHLAAAVALLLTAVAAGVVGLVRRSVLVPVCAVTAAVGAIVTLLTRPLVAWDQLGLWAVTVSTALSGYWPAAFDDEVRFVLVGATEVSPGEYAVVLAVHLGSSVVAVAALLVATVVTARSVRAAPRRTAAVAPAAA